MRTAACLATALLPFVTLGATGGSHAFAGAITYDMLPGGATLFSSDAPGGPAAQAIGGSFSQKTVAGVRATGISGGKVNGEIDGQQAMIFTFDSPVHITELSVAFLFTAGNHGDTENEIAQFTTDAGTFTLEAGGGSTPIWSGFGAPMNISPGIKGHAGLWSVTGEGIFGGPITSLVLQPGNPGNHARYGDFSFHSLAFAVVPAPGALPLCAALICLSRSRRRR